MVDRYGRENGSGAQYAHIQESSSQKVGAETTRGSRCVHGKRFAFPSVGDCGGVSERDKRRSFFLLHYHHGVVV